ncbi:MAG: hypothetical protein QNL88_07285 [Acidobacteriota bacterium]|nr:hypothetical protein [Acidobacteriota bacterium]
MIGNLVIRGSKGRGSKRSTITVTGTSVVQGDIEIHDSDRNVRLALSNGGHVTGSTGSAIVERITE